MLSVEKSPVNRLTNFLRKQKCHVLPVSYLLKKNKRSTYYKSSVWNCSLYPRRESNPYQQNRNLSFYPLNYGGRIVQRTKLQHFRRYYKFLCFSPRKKNVKTIYKVVAGAESLRKSSSHRFCIKSCSMPRVVLLCGRSLEAGWLVIIINFWIQYADL